MRRIESLIALQTSNFIRPKDDAWTAVKDKYIAMMGDSFTRMFGPNTDVDEFKFRASNLGYSPFLLAYEYFYPTERWTPSWSKSFKLYTGFIFEAFLSYILDRCGYSYNYQDTVTTTHGDLEIGGHPDFTNVQCEEEEPFIIEAKCVSNTVFEEYHKAGYVTNWKYLCQLSYYCLAKHMPGVFVVCNVDTGELAYYPLPDDLVLNKIQPHLMSNITNINYIVSCSEWWQTLERITPPTPKKRKDGTHYLTPDMYVSKGVLHPATIIYDIVEYNGQKNVIGYNYPEAAKQWEPSL